MPKKPSYYVTTAISYPNGPPHIGHAYEVIATDAIARFQQEAVAVARLRHPNIIAAYDFGKHSGRLFFVMELVEGEDLKHRISRIGAMDERTVWGLARQVVSGLAHAAHEGIVHRDIKPSNLLLDARGTVWITDFGLAKEMDSDEGHTRTGSIMGTPSYMPPEQAEGKAKHLNHLADIYSLGAMLYEFLTGRPPFKGRTLLETLEHVKKKDPVPPIQLQPDAPIDLRFTSALSVPGEFR